MPVRRTRMLIITEPLAAADMNSQQRLNTMERHGRAILTQIQQTITLFKLVFRERRRVYATATCMARQHCAATALLVERNIVKSVIRQEVSATLMRRLIATAMVMQRMMKTAPLTKYVRATVRITKMRAGRRVRQ